MPAPALSLKAKRDEALAATRKKSLRRHERYFQREGNLQVHHFDNGHTIKSQLNAFFNQHITRWAVTPYPSLFNDTVQQRFYYLLSDTFSDSGWLRFTRLDWNGQAIAYHFGFCYKGSYLWYKPSFDIELARRSPGEVLLRQLLLAAMDEGAHTFDFGLGDEPFKKRFETNRQRVHTWGLYPSDIVSKNQTQERIA